MYLFDLYGGRGTGGGFYAKCLLLFLYASSSTQSKMAIWVVLTLGADNCRIVMRVNPASGNCTLLSYVSPGVPTSLPVAHLGIAIEASGQVVIADDRVDAIVRVDTLGNGGHGRHLEIAIAQVSHSSAGYVSFYTQILPLYQHIFRQCRAYRIQ
jgi:hypothetical protein